MFVHYDCRYFLGSKPCVYHRECEGCPHYTPFGKRILLIKLAAMGDVLRTTPLLRGLRRAHPDCHLTWLTEANVMPLLAGIGEIDRVVPYSYETVLTLEHESFDIVYCFDKEPKAAALAMKVRGNQKVGFGLSEYGNVKPLNPESEYTFELGINDPLKFTINQKTYPELLFECASLPYEDPQEYVFPDLSDETASAERLLERRGASRGDLKIGLNTGAGDVFATKKWTERGYAELGDRLIADYGAKVILLGGPDESERNARIQSMAHRPLIDAGTDNTIRDFAGIVANCDIMVTGDTLAMHIAIGLHVPVVVLIGPTCHQEIELYGRGAKIVSDFDCSPCYLSVCPKEVTCMDATSTNQVFEAVSRVIEQTMKGATSNPS